MTLYKVTFLGRQLERQGIIPRFVLNITMARICDIGVQVMVNHLCKKAAYLFVALEELAPRPSML
uniref:Uncharacterized protein n=1 Tax=Rhizophora mucronata TaxID=61149 RepID=A0A2P2Q423_RHIMU